MIVNLEALSSHTHVLSLRSNLKLSILAKMGHEFVTWQHAVQICQSWTLLLNCKYGVILGLSLSDFFFDGSR